MRARCCGWRRLSAAQKRLLSCGYRQVLRNIHAPFREFLAQNPHGYCVEQQKSRIIDAAFLRSEARLACKAREESALAFVGGLLFADLHGGDVGLRHFHHEALQIRNLYRTRFPAFAGMTGFAEVSELVGIDRQ
jgi:DNA-binding SARP family transcriptional activator